MSYRLILGAALLSIAQLACSSGGKTTKCEGNLKADSKGHCVECLATTDCTAGTFCDGSGVCAACSTNPSSCSTANGSCMADADCGASGKICTDFVCVDGCKKNSDCGTGKYCDGTTHHCEMGCGADSQCAGLTCCPSHQCVDTQTNPAANCGGCGNPACPTGNACCDGACADFQTDSANCGSCGNACPNNIACVGGECQDGYGLFGLFGLKGKIAGDATEKVILKPLVYTRKGALDYQSLASRTCFASHFDATHPPSEELDAGNVLITGYAGGAFIDTNTAPTDIVCQFLGGDYYCGYGMLMENMLGPAVGQSPFPGASNPLGTAAVGFAAPGGATFGSFTLTATPATGLGAKEDLSTIVYTDSADVTLNIDCPSAGCGLGGYLIYVQATSNDVAHFDEKPTSGGSMVCLGGYGSLGGVIDLGLPTITIAQSDIATMLGGDASIKTFQTTVVSLGQNDLLAIGNARTTDSQGHQIIGLARTGSFGVSTKP